MQNICICIQMCLSSVWIQPPYNYTNALLFFLIPPKPKWSQLSSHFDFGVNNQCSLYPQYHDWGEIFKQGTKPPTALRVPQHWLPTAPGVCSRCVHVCSLLCVCVHLDVLNAEYKFWVWVTIFGHTSLHFHKIILCLAALYIFLLFQRKRGEGWAEIISM